MSLAKTNGAPPFLSTRLPVNAPELVVLVILLVPETAKDDRFDAR